MLWWYHFQTIRILIYYCILYSFCLSPPPSASSFFLCRLPLWNSPVWFFQVAYDSRLFDIFMAAFASWKCQIKYLLRLATPSVHAWVWHSLLYEYWEGGVDNALESRRTDKPHFYWDIDVAIENFLEKFDIWNNLYLRTFHQKCSQTNIDCVLKVKKYRKEMIKYDTLSAWNFQILSFL